MRVEKVPDSTYDMVGGLDKQIKEIKEVPYRSQPNDEHKNTSLN
jgi:ATP-dependent 26S proteasome regulatory subunit